LSTTGKKTGAAPAKEEKPATVEKSIGGAKNGEKRTISTDKASKYYPVRRPFALAQILRVAVRETDPNLPSTYYQAEDVRSPKASRKIPGSTKLRASITPGTVLILLAGRFRGKRVVFLKQLDSGLLLVSGPFRLNGVPLRRVGQAYVIATSTKVDLAGVSVPETVNDAYFTKSKAGKEGKEDQFFGDNKEKKLLSDDRKSEQKVRWKDAQVTGYGTVKLTTNLVALLTDR